MVTPLRTAETKLPAIGRDTVPSTGVDTATPQVIQLVFVAGASFSGSTLMGLMLGSQPEARFAGELKDYKRRMESEIRGTGSFCSCRESRENCSFWSAVQSRYARETELNPAPGFSLRNVLLGLRMLLGVGTGDRSDETAHGALVRCIYEEALARDPALTYIVDTSKSIHTLEAICRSPRMRVSVIHLIRDGMEVAGSYDKRGYRVIPAMLGWAIGNIFVKLSAKRLGLRLLQVDYRSLCLGDEATYGELNDFLGMQLDPARVTHQIRETTYHIVSGNGKVRRSASNFQGIRYSTSPFEAGPLQRLVGGLVVKPLNRAWGIGGGNA